MCAHFPSVNTTDGSESKINSLNVNGSESTVVETVQQT
jgi:hypothetical protein